VLAKNLTDLCTQFRKPAVAVHCMRLERQKTGFRMSVIDDGLSCKVVAANSSASRKMSIFEEIVLN
jgi:hypothetical protein